MHTTSPFQTRLINAEIDRRDHASRPIAPVVFIGIQSGLGFRPDFALYNVLTDLPRLTKGSTVSEETINAAGYQIADFQRGRSS